MKDIITNIELKQSKGLNGDLKPEHMVTTNRTTYLNTFKLQWLEQLWDHGIDEAILMSTHNIQFHDKISLNVRLLEQSEEFRRGKKRV